MRKYLLTSVALILLCVNSYTATLSSQTDSLNYAIGLLNGLQLRSQEDIVVSDLKARDAFLSAMDKSFASTEMPDELQRIGTDVSIIIAGMSQTGLAEIKAWKFDAAICLQALVNGLYGDTAWSKDAAMDYFQNQYLAVAGNDSLPVSKQVKAKLQCPTKVKAVKLKTQTDSLNYAFGFLEGCQLAQKAVKDEDKVKMIGIINQEFKNYNPYSKLEQMGASIGLSLAAQRSSGLLGVKTIALNYPVIRSGLAEGFAGKTDVFDMMTAEQYLNEKMMKLQQSSQAAQAEETKREGEAFLAINGQRPEVTTTPSGLQYEVLRQGTGSLHPTAQSKVRVHYHGTLINGTVFDSSVERGEPISFPLSGVIRGWTEGVQLMTEGAKFRFFIPYQLAYGERGAGGQIPPYAALIFDVELLAIE